MLSFAPIAAKSSRRPARNAQVPRRREPSSAPIAGTHYEYNHKQAERYEELFGALTTAVAATSAVISAVGLWIAYERILPETLRTKSMANGFVMLGLGFVAVCFSFASLLAEGRSRKKSVPVLALRVVVSIIFFAWVSIIILNGTFISPLAGNMSLLSGSIVLTIVFLITLVMGRQVEVVAEAEAEKTVTLDDAKRRCADLDEEIALAGPSWMKIRVSKLVEEFKFLSPSDNENSRELENRMIVLLKDLIATIPAQSSTADTMPGTVQKVDELESLLRRRKKLLSE